jgi:Tfp pilus assembly protein PilF
MRRWFPEAACAGLVVLAFLVYGNTFGVPFLLDDYVFIVESESIRKFALPFFESGAAAPNWIDPRPVADLSFRLNYQISGLNVWSFHLLNVCIHAASAVLLCLVLQQILATRLSVLWSQTAAFVSAALWVVHPININAVTYISQRFESLAAFFALAALAAFLRSRIGGTRSGQWWCIVFVFASFGSKESYLALPLLIWLLDRFVLPVGHGDRIRRKLFYVLLLAAWCFSGLLYASSQRGEWTQNEGGALLFLGNLKMQSVVVLHYCGKLLWPSCLVFDEGKWPAPSYLQWLLATAVLAAIFAWSVLAVFRGKLPAFAVCSFFLLLAPSSSVVVVPTYDAADYRMYLPSACLIALAAGSLACLLQKHRGQAPRMVFVACAAVLVVCLGTSTWRRNQIYKSPVDLWSDNIAKRPLHSGSYVGLAESLMKEGQLAEAESTLSHAREKFPGNARLLNLSGMVAIQDGREIAATVYWRQARELAPANHVILNNLAIAAYRNGDTTGAADLFAQVVSLRPRDVIALGNLAQVRMTQGKLGEAQILVRRGLDLVPQDALLQGLKQRIDALLLKSDSY